MSSNNSKKAEDNGGKDFVCETCSKSFHRKGNLVLHLDTHMNGKTPNAEKARPHGCTICPKKFTFKKNLLKHIRTIHKDTGKADQLKVKKIKCPEENCIYSCRNMNDLRKHVSNVHSVRILKDCLQFSNEGVFLKWKKEEEINSVSWFVAFRQKSYLRSGYIKQTLSCHRTGDYKPKGYGKHRLKSHGSCKIGGTCPAAMEVLEYPDGRLTVNYYKTHVGHKSDLVHLQLSKEERTKLCEKIEEGFTLDAILEDAKEDVKKPPTKRIHLLSRKDLYNIKQSKTNDDKKSTSKIQRSLQSETDMLERAQNGLSLSEDSIPSTESIQLTDLNVRIVEMDQVQPSEKQLMSTDRTTDTVSVLTNNEQLNASQIITYQKIAQFTPDMNQENALPAASQVLIVSPDMSYRSVTEFLLLQPADNITPTITTQQMTENTFTTCSDEKMKQNEVKTKQNKKDNQLSKKLEEKINKIYKLLDKSENLTPKQYDSVNNKLDSILNIYESITMKVKIKKMLSRKDRKKKINVDSDKDRAVVENNEASVVNVSLAQPVYEAQLYTYFSGYS